MNVKDGPKTITFGDNKIGKQKFHNYKNLIFKKYVDVDNILISNRFFSEKKYYKYVIGYMNDQHDT